MTISVLIINSQLVFAVKIKQALEQTGAFTVHSFTSVDPAIDYLREHPQDVALVDFTMPDVPGGQIVRRLRMVQADIAVIISPSQDDKDLIRRLDIQGVIDAPFTARAIIPLIENAVAQIEEPLDAITRSFDEVDQSEVDVTEVLTDDHYSGFNAPEAPPPNDEAGRTRMLEEADDAIEDFFGPVAPPPDLPEFSSLDDVLSSEAPSEMFEPPVAEGDTPAVPDIDSDAMRQFLATKGEDGRTFNEVLGSLDISPEDAESAFSDFENLVNSMKGEKSHTPLPDRHQQFIEFILTGGMDTLLTEIERAKVPGEAEDDDDIPAGGAAEPSAPPSSFEQLSAEEPPMPGLEESGTIGDLMVGISDTSFRNVLAMMRGEETVEQVDDLEAPSREEIDEAFNTFFEREMPAEDDVQEPDELFDADDEEEAISPTAFIQQRPDWLVDDDEEDDEGSEGTFPAQLILETAFDETVPPDSFSLDDLISNIESQLNQHEPQIEPLPSWGGQIKLPRRQQPPEAEKDESSGIAEPDFLPEQFDTGLLSSVNPDRPETLPEVDQDEPPRVIRPIEPEAPIEHPSIRRIEPDTVDSDEEEEDTELWAQRYADDLFGTASDAAEWPEADDEMMPGIFAEDAGPFVDLPEDWATQEYDPFAPPAGAEAQPQRPTDEIPPNIWEEPPQVDVWGESEAADWAPDDESVFDPWDAAYDEAENEPVVDAWDEPPIVELPIDDEPEQATALLAPEMADSVDFGRAADFEPPPTSTGPVDFDDPYIAQLALSLTQVSLETTAEASLLTSGSRIIAFAGQLPEAEVTELSASIADDWEAQPGEARVRFIRLEGSGAEYMLYSRRTEGDFTLSMVFAAATPLRDIRRQGKRLVELLDSVPENMTAAYLPDEPEQAATEPQTRLRHAYVWLLRDPNAALSDAAAWAIVSGLTTQLNEQGWQIDQFIAREEYVYLLAEVPGEASANAQIGDLKRRSAAILRQQSGSMVGPDVWADSYLVMTPGRELDSDEIYQFINFERTL